MAWDLPRARQGFPCRAGQPITTHLEKTRGGGRFHPILKANLTVPCYWICHPEHTHTHPPTVLYHETSFLRSCQLLLQWVCISPSPEVHLATGDNVSYADIVLSPRVTLELISLLRANPSCDQWFTQIEDLKMLRVNNEEKVCFPLPVFFTNNCLCFSEHITLQRCQWWHFLV